MLCPCSHVLQLTLQSTLHTDWRMTPPSQRDRTPCGWHCQPINPVPQCDLSGVHREGVSAGPWHALGSPVSVVIAKLVVEDVEQRALATFHSPPHFWKHYVDDTFTVLPATWCRSSSATSTARKHASSSLLKTGRYHSWMCVCAESLRGLSLQQCTRRQCTPTNTCPLIHIILWHTQCLSGEEFDELSQCTIIKWCGGSGRREENCWHTEEEWLPTEVHSQALTLQERTQTSGKWPKASKDQSDHSLHQWFIIRRSLWPLDIWLAYR